MKDLIKELPPSDAFIFLRIANQGNSSRETVVARNLCLLLENAFMALMASDSDDSWRHKFYYMPQSGVSRSFGLLVGGEKVSCLDMLNQVLDGKYRHYRPQNTAKFRGKLARIQPELYKDDIGFQFLQCLFFIHNELNPVLAKQSATTTPTSQT